ncbi:hypothetical protein [Streptomyces sp. SID3343]|uniref:hypothetical protein n=1 Tax=Streptomyces sp. SID3343 TaxID=2690260 RepID=UPI0013703CB2|nr:hypothetical protein [Streptomyces sp. SID3343]MYW03535.1 hypothetical protein [Streptomyces sp. SID3343]
MHTSHRVRRTVTTAAALGLTAAGVLTAGAAGSAGAAPSDTRTQSQATPTATASRTTQLAAAGDEVTVTARGFAPGAKVTVALYAGDVADSAATRTLTADAGGFIATPLVVGTAFAPDAPAFEIRTSAAGGPAAKVAVTFAAAAPKAGDVRTARSAQLTAQAPNAPAAAQAPQALQAPQAPKAPQAPQAAGGVKITVTPSSDIDPAGATITVTGSGYAAGSGTGIYVVFGPKAADWTTNAGNYGASKWLKAVPAPGSDSINADGTFSVKLPDVKAVYKDGAGKDVDCRKTDCYILTMAAHGSPDRSQDAFTKVTFKDGATTSGATSGATTGATTGGATTGATTTGGATGTTTTGATTAGNAAAKSGGGGGSLPLTGPVGLATAGVVGAGLIAAGTFAVVTTRRRRASTPPTTA